MRVRAILLVFMLGLWCGATVFMWFVATQNFAVVEDILGTRQPEFFATTSALSYDQLRLAMRHQASEVNRLFFSGWGWVQMPLAFGVVWLAWRSRGGKVLIAEAALMLLITLFLGLYVVPETVRLGRILDFLPRDPEPPQSTSFWLLHHTYTALDMLKFIVGLVMVFRLTWKARAWS